MNVRTVLSIAAFAALACNQAFATVMYSFEGFNSELTQPYLNPISFVLTVPDFITTDTLFDASVLDSCSNPASSCVYVVFNMDGAELGLPGLSVIEFGGVFQGSFHYFNPSAFHTPGTYSTVVNFNPATLSVSAVPEPGTASLGLLGLAALGYSASRRQASGVRSGRI